MVHNNKKPNSDSEEIHLLSKLDLDCSSINESFSNLTEMAAKISECKISLINFIDQHTLWSVANFGIETLKTPREETVCQFTLGEEVDSNGLEILNLSSDARYKELHFVKNHPWLNYYFGLPIFFKNRVKFGTLCVMDQSIPQLSEDKKKLLRLLIKEIEDRLIQILTIAGLEDQLNKSERVKNKLAHDMRGPLGGIVGLSELVKSEGLENTPEEMLEYFNVIHQSSSTMLELATDILTGKSLNRSVDRSNRLFDLYILRDKINQLYAPSALAKSIKFEVLVEEFNSEINFPRLKLLQILGNLVSNAIKFTPFGGRILIKLAVQLVEHTNILQIHIQDSGIGMMEEQVLSIENGGACTTLGTEREAGFGMGLDFVKDLIEKMHGEFSVDSELGVGTSIHISLPFFSMPDD